MTNSITSRNLAASYLFAIALVGCHRDLGSQVQLTFPKEYVYVGEVIISGDGFIILSLEKGPNLLLFRKRDAYYAAGVYVERTGEIYDGLEEKDFVPMVVVRQES